MLSLRSAISEGRVAEFIEQEEARGVGPIGEAEFDALAADLIRRPRSGDQTSGSLPNCDLPEK